jgi:hypothetical protein
VRFSSGVACCRTRICLLLSSFARAAAAATFTSRTPRSRPPKPTVGPQGGDPIRSDPIHPPFPLSRRREDAAACVFSSSFVVLRNNLPTDTPAPGLLTYGRTGPENRQLHAALLLAAPCVLLCCSQEATHDLHRTCRATAFITATSVRENLLPPHERYLKEAPRRRRRRRRRLADTPPGGCERTDSNPPIQRHHHHAGKSRVVAVAAARPHWIRSIITHAVPSFLNSDPVSQLPAARCCCLFRTVLVVVVRPSRIDRPMIDSSAAPVAAAPSPRSTSGARSCETVIDPTTPLRYPSSLCAATDASAVSHRLVRRACFASVGRPRWGAGSSWAVVAEDETGVTRPGVRVREREQAVRTVGALSVPPVVGGQYNPVSSLGILVQAQVRVPRPLSAPVLLVVRRRVVTGKAPTGQQACRRHPAARRQVGPNQRSNNHNNTRCRPAAVADPPPVRSMPRQAGYTYSSTTEIGCAAAATAALTSTTLSLSPPPPYRADRNNNNNNNNKSSPCQFYTHARNVQCGPRRQRYRPLSC